MFLWVLSCSSKLNETEEGLVGTMVCSQMVRCIGSNLNLLLAFDVGWSRVAVLQNWSLTCGIWCYLKVGSDRIELNYSTPSWCSENCLDPLIPCHIRICTKPFIIEAYSIFLNEFVDRLWIKSYHTIIIQAQDQRPTCSSISVLK